MTTCCPASHRLVSTSWRLPVNPGLPFLTVAGNTLSRVGALCLKNVSGNRLHQEVGKQMHPDIYMPRVPVYMYHCGAPGAQDGGRMANGAQEELAIHKKST